MHCVTHINTMGMCCVLQCVAVCCSVLQCVAVRCAHQYIRHALHVTHVNVLRHTREYIVSSIRMHHVTNVNASCHAFECSRADANDKSPHISRQKYPIPQRICPTSRQKSPISKKKSPASQQKYHIPQEEAQYLKTRKSA